MSDAVLILIMALGGVILVGFAINDNSKTALLIDACELELPRSESCILIAVPKQGD